MLVGFELATSNAKHFTIKRSSRAAALRQFESGYQLQKAQHSNRGAVLFRVGRFRTGDLKCEAFYNKAKQPRSGASPVRIWLSRRRKLHIACDDFLCFASKFASRSFRCSASQNQNRMAATGLVDNFGPPLCRVLFLQGRGIAEIAPHGSEKADAKAASSP